MNICNDCYSGSSVCSHVLSSNKLQIKPCRVVSILFVFDVTCFDEEWKLFCGLANGFNTENIPEYDCCNYKSILEPAYKEKMDCIISFGLANGMLSEVSEKSQCVHALGAFLKPDGGMRPMIDCSRPEGKNVTQVQWFNCSSLRVSVKL